MKPSPRARAPPRRHQLLVMCRRGAVTPRQKPKADQNGAFDFRGGVITTSFSYPPRVSSGGKKSLDVSVATND